MARTTIKELMHDAVDSSVLGLRGVPCSHGRILRVENEQYLDFCTCSYLGLDTDEEYLDTARKTIDSHGLGRCASPIYAAPDFYDVITQRLSEITRLPEILLFNSNSMANFAAIKYGLPARSTIFADEHCHRSLVEGMKLRRKVIYRYANNDIESLSARLSTHVKGSPAIITDGVFSMSGARAATGELARLLESCGGHLLIDDAHGFGVLGRQGEGMLCEIPKMLRDHIIYVGSLTKALSGFGGFVACSEHIAKRIRLASPQYGFSCCIPLVYAAVSAKACEMLGTAKWRRLQARLERNWKILALGVKDIGRSLMAGYSPVAVVKMLDEAELRQASIALEKERIAFNVVGFPAVPKGDWRLRFCLSAAHTKKDVETLVGVLTDVLVKSS